MVDDDNYVSQLKVIVDYIIWTRIVRMDTDRHFFEGNYVLYGLLSIRLFCLFFLTSTQFYREWRSQSILVFFAVETPEEK